MSAARRLVARPRSARPAGARPARARRAREHSPNVLRLARMLGRLPLKAQATIEGLVSELLLSLPNEGD